MRLSSPSGTSSAHPINQPHAVPGLAVKESGEPIGELACLSFLLSPGHEAVDEMGRGKVCRCGRCLLGGRGWSLTLFWRCAWRRRAVLSQAAERKGGSHRRQGGSGSVDGFPGLRGGGRRRRRAGCSFFCDGVPCGTGDDSRNTTRSHYLRTRSMMPGAAYQPGLCMACVQVPTYMASSLRASHTQGGVHGAHAS